MKHIYLIIEEKATPDTGYASNLLGAYTGEKTARQDLKEVIENARPLVDQMGLTVIKNDQKAGTFEAYRPQKDVDIYYKLRLVKQALGDTRNVHQKMTSCLQELIDIRSSGYIPYTSPSPSSTELTIKSELNAAINYLEGAIHFHETTYGI